MKHQNVKDVLSDMLWPCHLLDFHPSQSRNWHWFCWGGKHMETLETREVLMHTKCVWFQLLRSDTLMRIASTVSWRYGWAGGPSCQLEMRLVWSLDRKVETAMKVLKSPTIVSGFKKHTRRKGNIRLLVRGFRTSMQTKTYTSWKSYLPRA